MPWFAAGKYRYLGVGIAVLAAAGLCYPLLPNVNSQAGEPPPVADKGAPEIRLNSDAVLRQVVYHRKCDESTTVDVEAVQVAGLDYVQFQARYPRWNIESFRPDKVVMSLQNDDLCDNHKENMFIGVYNGKVAIFYGSPSGKPVLKEQTKITVDELNAQTLDELKNGITVQSKEELLMILEGLNSK